MPEKLFIKNRKGEKIAALIEKPDQPKGLAFVMHGLGGFKEQPHIETFAKAFFENGFTVVRFDTTNSIGESDGEYENATTTNYYEDLEDVIAWANTQAWYQEPFALCGHSLGGICTALYAEKYPEKVKALAPVATVVSGALTVEAHKRYEPEEYALWEKNGVLEKYSESKAGVVKRLRWSHMADRVKYDLLPKAGKLTMPVLLIVGSEDWGTSPEHHRMLYEKLPGKKELHIIKGAPHTFRKKQDLEEIRQILDRWIKSF
jgi:pimeloyl-ACP methyl ester carboxylesterase